MRWQRLFVLFPPAVLNVCVCVYFCHVCRTHVSVDRRQLNVQVSTGVLAASLLFCLSVWSSEQQRQFVSEGTGASIGSISVMIWLHE